MTLTSRTPGPIAALFFCTFIALPAAPQTVQRQTQEDDYTRYELLGPDTAQFRILYEVTATTAGRTVLLQRHSQRQHRHR